MAPDPAGDPRSAGNSRTTGSVADIDSTQDFEDLDGDIDMTDRGVNPGDSGGAANDGGSPQEVIPDVSNKAASDAPSSFGDDPNDAFDSEAPTG
ncbi:MAG: hypothetical protein ABIY70_01100 [Capsulimonas sp.]|uniref:hypothetical protein n=1 Tax=Capsulimonas sp. TaxID=2494211 RepID=UPI0032642FD1